MSLRNVKYDTTGINPSRISRCNLFSWVMRESAVVASVWFPTRVAIWIGMLTKLATIPVDRDGEFVGLRLA